MGAKTVALKGDANTGRDGEMNTATDENGARLHSRDFDYLPRTAESGCQQGGGELDSVQRGAVLMALINPALWEEKRPGEGLFTGHFPATRQLERPLGKTATLTSASTLALPSDGLMIS